MLGQEIIYRAIQDQNWTFLMQTLQNSYKEILSDPLLKKATLIFVSEFLTTAEKYPSEDQQILEYLEILWLIHQGNFYKLEASNHLKLICQLVNRKKDSKLEEAYTLAQLYPTEKICSQVIDLYKSSKPLTVIHSQSDTISVTEQEIVSDVDYTINLFKSKQEIEFFSALRKTYDSYQIYPNVAISCLLNWDLISGELTQKEKDYYFRGIVDFVVFDQADGFKPIYFFELDSVFHDIDKIKSNDKLKDSIFSKAGIKIKRIRKKNKQISTDELIKLIREL